MARIPRNQLLDLIFQLFRDNPRWGIKHLRERTQQPEVYLKEVLSEVAFLNKTGEYASLWELKDTFKDEGVSLAALMFPYFYSCQSRSANVAGLPGELISFGDSDVKMEGVEEDEDDDDMEEVS
jgi:transcription initiation factor TFIIF subunit beta